MLHVQIVQDQGKGGGEETQPALSHTSLYLNYQMLLMDDSKLAMHAIVLSCWVRADVSHYCVLATHTHTLRATRRQPITNLI